MGCDDAPSIIGAVGSLICLKKKIRLSFPKGWKLHYRIRFHRYIMLETLDFFKLDSKISLLFCRVWRIRYAQDSRRGSSIGGRPDEPTDNTSYSMIQSMKVSVKKRGDCPLAITHPRRLE